MHIDRKSKAKYYLVKNNKRWEVAEPEKKEIWAYGSQMI